MYVDESGTVELTDQTQYFVTAGTIFHEDALDTMKTEIDTYKDTNFTGKMKFAEIHVYDIWKGRGKFFGLNLTQKRSILDPLYQSISNLQFTSIAVRIDKKKFAKRHNDPNEVLNYGYMLLIERFDYFLRENKSKGIIRIDKTTPPDKVNLNEKDDYILRIINRIRKRGTRWQTPAENIIEEPHFLHSHTRKGLQVADAVSYCITRKSNSMNDFDSYWNLIYPKFRKSTYGTVDGFGLITYPK